MSLGERVMNVFNQFIVDNSFYIVVLVCVVLFVVDFYHRFLRVVKNTEGVDLLERYIWLTYYRNRKAKRSVVWSDNSNKQI